MKFTLHGGEKLGLEQTSTGKRKNMMGLENDVLNIYLVEIISCQV